MSTKFFFITSLSIFLSVTSMAKTIGTVKKPIVITLVPGQNTIVLEEEGKKVEKFLNENTKYKYKIVVPTSYIAVVEAIGSKRADIAFINTYGYYLANKKYGAKVYLTGELNGTTTYRGQILARHDGPKTLKELNDKKMAYVDPASTSGFILPSTLLAKEKVNLKEHVFAGRHDSAVIMLYQGQVDAAATYNSPMENGEPQDARKLVKTQYPDVFDKIKILAFTDEIPNDPVIARKDLPKEIIETTMKYLKKYGATPEGKVTYRKMYNMTSLVDANQKKYAEVSKFYDSFKH